MKGNSRKSVLLAVVAMLVLVVFVPMANTQGPEAVGKSADKHWSALDNVDRLKDTMEKAGFTLQEGTVEYMDWVMETCELHMRDTAFNNPAPNAYATLILPPPPGGMNPIGEWVWQLGEQEAIVLVGKTPPAAKYFSYQTILGFLPISPWPPPERYLPRRVAPSVGDALNINTIKTIGPDRVERPIVIVITGHRGTEQAVRKSLLAAGYPDAIINVEAIAPALGPLGVNDKGSWFYFAHRVAVPENKDDLLDYLKTLGKSYRVFRVTPNQQLAEQLGADPERVPVLRVRGTGQTEMDLYPALKQLRQAILDRHVGKPYKELDTHVFTAMPRDGREVVAEKPYVGLQRDIQVLGVTRDTNYLATYPTFMLRENVNEFVIVYGVNHQATGKATYASVGAYADWDRWFGIGTKLSTEFGDSARDYLPVAQFPDPDIDMLYAIKVARNCMGEDHCLQIDQPEFLDLGGNPYPYNPDCSLDDLDTPEIDPRPFDLDEKVVFFIFRSYMEPATSVGPDDNELLYDRAIYFGPYFEEP
ncbi:MAG: hypothetical protein PHY79_17345 [Anaerolineae bacterium]|nr:hypothetical protein [Anaerolineae bacterium]